MSLYFQLNEFSIDQAHLFVFPAREIVEHFISASPTGLIHFDTSYERFCRVYINTWQSLKPTTCTQGCNLPPFPNWISGHIALKVDGGGDLSLAVEI